MTALVFTVLAVVLVAGPLMYVLTHHRQETTMTETATETEDLLPKREVDFGAYAAWVALGCDQPGQYAICEEVARAVLAAVVPVRDAAQRRAGAEDAERLLMPGIEHGQRLRARIEALIQSADGSEAVYGNGPNKGDVLRNYVMLADLRAALDPADEEADR